MRHLPATWTEAPLSSLLAEPLANGRSVPDGTGFPVLRLSALRDDVIDFSERKRGSWSEGEAEPFLVKGGDLLVARGNGSLRLVGRARLVPSNPPEVAFPDTMIRVRPRATVVDPRFLAIQWEAPRTRSQVERAARTTAGIYKVSQGDLRDLRMVVPPLALQQRIVAAIETQFSRLDAAVAMLTRAKANVKRARASVLKSAVEGRLVPTEAALARAEDRDYEPASVLLDRILAERKATRAASGARGNYKEPMKLETGGLPTPPRGWCWVTVDALSMVSGGITKNAGRVQRDQEVPYLRVANVYADRLRLDDVSTIMVSDEELPRLLLQRGDLLIVEGNGSADQLGRVAVWSGSIAPCIHQNHLIKARPLRGVSERWLLHWMLSPSGRRAVQSVASSTSGLHTLSISKVQALPVILPPLAEQHRIVAEVDRRLSVLDALDTTLTANLARCARLRQSILKRAFEGRLVPSEAPIGTSVEDPLLATNVVP